MTRTVSLADNQLQSVTVNLQKCLNSSSLLGKITHIRCLQLQFNERLVNSPLEQWSVPFKDCSRSSYIALSLSLLNNSSLSFTSNFTNNIIGGSFPITDILNLTGYQKASLYQKSDGQRI